MVVVMEDRRSRRVRKLGHRHGNIIEWWLCGVVYVWSVCLCEQFCVCVCVWGVERVFVVLYVVCVCVCVCGIFVECVLCGVVWCVMFVWSVRWKRQCAVCGRCVCAQEVCGGCEHCV